MHGRNYLQIHGAAIGTKMAVTLANIFIADIEIQILIYHMGSVSFVLSEGSNLIFHAHSLLSKKLVAVLIVTGEGGAETIAENNSKTIQYIFYPRGII